MYSATVICSSITCPTYHYSHPHVFYLRSVTSHLSLIDLPFILRLSECLSGYLKTAEGTKCPICRAPVSGETPPPPPPPRPPRPPGGSDAPQGPGGMGGSGGGCCASSFEDSTYVSTRTYSPAREAEFRFRMNRMHVLYPRVMTGETLMALNAALSTGSATEFRRAASERSAEVQRTITNMETRGEAATSGSRGSSYGSFGGGSR
jgi:hypothetical protein